jgi:hypothetical protein
MISGYLTEQLLLAQCSVVLLSDCEGDVTIPQWMHDDASQLVIVEERLQHKV